MADWFEWIRQITTSGNIQFGRVRVITEPPTAYLRFEIERLTPPAVQAGEDIRLLPESRAKELQLPDHDFWIFDDQRVAVMTFDEHGVSGADLTVDAATVAYYRSAQQRAISAAIPFADWDVSV